MKYIVVYILAILWISTSGTAAQKPAIVLLPAAQEHIHPEAWIDTSYTKDSPVIAVQKESPEERIPEYKEKENEPGTEILSQKTGNYSLLFKKLNHIKFFIHFTALKYNL